MEDIKNLLNQKTKETENNAKESSLGVFLLKNHDDVFDNMDIMAHEMATTPLKRYFMLTGESDGLDLIIKLGGEKLYKDSAFKLFVTLMVQYFNKIKNDEKYVDVEEYKYNEHLIYDKFKSLFEKIKDDLKDENKPENLS